MLVSGTWQNRDQYKEANVAKKIIHLRTKKQYEENMYTAAQNSMKLNDMRKLYETVNGVRRKTVPSPIICNDCEGNLLTDKMVADRCTFRASPQDIVEWKGRYRVDSLVRWTSSGCPDAR